MKSRTLNLLYLLLLIPLFLSAQIQEDDIDSILKFSERFDQYRTDFIGIAENSYGEDKDDAFMLTMVSRMAYLHAYYMATILIMFRAIEEDWRPEYNVLIKAKLQQFTLHSLDVHIELLNSYMSSTKNKAIVITANDLKKDLRGFKEKLELVHSNLK